MHLKLFAKITAVFVFAMGCCATAVRAQDTTVKTPSRYCWRGQPKPACDGFLLTEFGLFRSVIQPVSKVPYTFYPDTTRQSYYEVRDIPWNLTGEVGGMVNITTRTAVGATILLGTNWNGGTVGVKARYRRWLNPEGIALDIGAGVRSSESDFGNYVYLSSAPYRQPGPTPAFTADVAINARDYVALVARVDLTKFGGRYRPNIALGVRAGSKPGVIAAGAVAATYVTLFGLLYLAFSGSDF